MANFALRYRAHLARGGALDYAELVLAATRLLKENESVPKQCAAIRHVSSTTHKSWPRRSCSCFAS